MARIIVATNPADDDVTKYLDVWQELVTDLAKKQKDTFIFELNRQKTNKRELTELIEKKNPNLIIFNGHGSYDTIFGFDGGVLIKCNDNEALLKKRIVHALTCDSAKKLGPTCIKIGTLAYIGYKEEFKLTYLNKNTKQEIADDEIAKLFLDPAFEAVFSLIKGHSAEESYKISQKKCLENLSIAVASSSPKMNMVIASRLYHNLMHQVCLGDSSSRF